MHAAHRHIFRYHEPDFTTRNFCSAMIRFFIIFSVLLVGLFTLEILQPAERFVILPFTSLIAELLFPLVVWLVAVALVCAVAFLSDFFMSVKTPAIKAANTTPAKAIKAIMIFSLIAA